MCSTDLATCPEVPHHRLGFTLMQRQEWTWCCRHALPSTDELAMHVGQVASLLRSLLPKQEGVHRRRQDCNAPGP